MLNLNWNANMELVKKFRKHDADFEDHRELCEQYGFENPLTGTYKAFDCLTFGGVYDNDDEKLLSVYADVYGKFMEFLVPIDELGMNIPVDIMHKMGAKEIVSTLTGEVRFMVKTELGYRMLEDSRYFDDNDDNIEYVLEEV